MDIKIEKIHKETSSSQFEIVMHYDDVKKAIDKYHIVR